MVSGMRVRELEARAESQILKMFGHIRRLDVEGLVKKMVAAEVSGRKIRERWREHGIGDQRHHRSKG